MTLPFSFLKNISSLIGLVFVVIFLLNQASAQDDISWEHVWNKEVQSAAESDSTKVRDIVKWISNRVEYETDIRYQKNRSNINLPVAKRAYLDGKAVCIGFAKLFQALCEAANIPAITVEGVAYLQLEDNFENHAWNVVKYGGIWRVVDPTWGSGHIENREYQKTFSPRFIDISFEDRKFSHYPYDPALQLHIHPLTFEEFNNRELSTYTSSKSFDSQSLDSILQNYSGLTDTSALQRSLEFKPDDLFLKQLLADEYMQIAEKHIQSCIQWYSQGPDQEEINTCQEIIRETENWLKKSQKLYLTVKKERKRSSNSSTDVNLQNIERNLKTLHRMKSFSP